MIPRRKLAGLDSRKIELKAGAFEPGEAQDVVHQRLSRFECRSMISKMRSNSAEVVWVFEQGSPDNRAGSRAECAARAKTLATKIAPQRFRSSQLGDVAKTESQRRARP